MMATDDRTTPSLEAWAAFLEALGYTVSSLDIRPATSAGLLLRATAYTETHPVAETHEQENVRAMHSLFAGIVHRMVAE
jgi:hypothetical protein